MPAPSFAEVQFGKAKSRPAYLAGRAHSQGRGVYPSLTSHAGPAWSAAFLCGQIEDKNIQPGGALVPLSGSALGTSAEVFVS